MSEIRQGRRNAKEDVRNRLWFSRQSKCKCLGKVVIEVVRREEEYDDETTVDNIIHTDIDTSDTSIEEKQTKRC